MQVDLIGNLDDFDALEEEWDDCLGDMRGGNPFLTHGWIRNWWLVFGDSAELTIVLVRDGDELVAAAPLFRATRRYYGIPLRQIMFIGTGTYDRLSFLRRTDDGRPLRLIMHELRSMCAGSTLARLESLPHADPVLAASRDVDGLWVEETTGGLPYIPINTSWDDYRKQLKHKFRSEMRTRVKVFNRWGDWRLERSRGAEVKSHLQTMAELEAISAKKAHGAAFLSDPANRDLVGRLVDLDGPVEPVLLSLVVNEVLVAYLLGFVHGRVLCAYNTAFHPDYVKGSPGKWIMDQGVKFAFDEDLSEFDFLRGEFGYKARWQPRVRTSKRMVLFPPNPLGWALRAAVFGIRPRLKRLAARGAGR